MLKRLTSVEWAFGKLAPSAEAADLLSCVPEFGQERAEATYFNLLGLLLQRLAVDL